MHTLAFLLGMLVPKAHAILNTVGSGGAGVDDMWTTICNTFPAAFCNLGANAPEYIAGIVVDFVFAVIVGIGVLVIIFAGLRLIFAAGNEEATADAKKIITYALLGIVLALMAEAIKTFVIVVVERAAG
jgi:hypothetical protein